MRVASRKGRRIASVTGGAKRRKPRRMPDKNMPDSDRRLFTQLCVSAVLVAVAVIIGVTGGGIRDGFVTMIERSADLSQVNEALGDFSVKVPVLSALFDEGITPVFQGAFRGVRGTGGRGGDGEHGRRWLQHVCHRAGAGLPRFRSARRGVCLGV